jgi:hypothetical protein
MDKSELKAHIVNDLGVRFEDMREAAKLDEAKNDGAQAALRALAKKIQELSIQVDKDLDAGLLGNLDGPLAVAAEIKKYLVRVGALIDMGAHAADNHKLMHQGRGAAFQQMIENMKKIYDAEMQKASERKAISEGAVTIGRPQGISPGLSLKERRRMEEMVDSTAAAEAPAQSEDVSSEAEETDVDTLEAESDGENVPIGLVPKRRGKRGKNS